MVANGCTMYCMRNISQLKLLLNHYEVNDDFYIVNIRKIDDVLGMQLLPSLGEITLNSPWS